MRTGKRLSMALGAVLLGLLALGACGGGGSGRVEITTGGTLEGASVSLSPRTAIVAKAGTQVFTATLVGTPSDEVVWSVDGLVHGSEEVGTITWNDTTATFKAPSSEGDHVVVASSAADASLSAAASVSVRDSCAPPPASVTLVSVRSAPYGARGDGTTDDTQAIQEAVDDIAGTGGTVLVPAGTYLVDAADGGILLRSDMTLRFDPGSVLQAKPTSASSYSILRAVGVSNVRITGSGTLQGERDQHTGTAGEFGRGLNIGDAHNVVVENLTARDCWGDGFYIGAGSTGIVLCGVTGRDNRRGGVSITSVDGLTIRDSVFQGSHGTIPECGLNIEPNAGERVNDVQILGCTFEDNHGTGLAAGVPCAYSATVSNLVIDGNSLRNNGWGALAGAASGLELSKCNGTRITGNSASGNAGDGILLRACGTSSSGGANHTIISGNAASNNARAGILEEYCDDNTITWNTGSGNGRYGIHSSHCTNREIHDNSLPETFTD